MSIDNDNVDSLIKAVQNVQETLDKEMANNRNKTLSVSSGGGMVTATVNWNQELVSLTFEREVVNPDDREMLIDLIVAAVNEALSQVREKINQEVAKIYSQINLP